MSSVTRIVGPNAEKLAEIYLKKLQEMGLYDTYTVEVNGVASVFEVQEGGISTVHRDVTVVELPSYLAPEKQEELLAALTEGHPDVFGTAVNGVKTLGSVRGHVF